MYLRLFAHILVGFLIGALYYDIGNDGGKVLSNLGFLFFNMLFLMYTSMTITILSCELKSILCWPANYADTDRDVKIETYSGVAFHFSSTGNARSTQREFQQMVFAEIVLPCNNRVRHPIPGKLSSIICYYFH